MTIKANGYSNRIKRAKTILRRKEANERNDKWAKLSRIEKIKLLKSRPGKSKKQMTKLMEE